MNIKASSLLHGNCVYCFFNSDLKLVNSFAFIQMLVEAENIRLVGPFGDSVVGVRFGGRRFSFSRGSVMEYVEKKKT